MVTWTDIWQFFSFVLGSTALIIFGLIICYTAVRVMAVAWHRTKKEFENHDKHVRYRGINSKK